MMAGLRAGKAIGEGTGDRSGAKRATRAVGGRTIRGWLEGGLPGMAEARWGRPTHSAARWLLVAASLGLLAASAWAWVSWSWEASRSAAAGLVGRAAVAAHSEADRSAETTDLVLEARAVDGGSRAEALRALREVRIASRALSHIRKRYVEPDRVRPRVMLEAGLQALAHRIPEMLVDTPERDVSGEPLSLRVRVGEAELRLDISAVADLFHLNWALLKAMRFIAGHLPEDVPAATVEYVAVNGMLATLDPYSHMLDPDAYRDMRTNTGGRFGGLGIRILAIDGVLTIVGVIEGSPAERAGVAENDQILLIDGEDTLNMSIDESVDRLRGEVGSPARLMIRRKGWSTPREVVVVRAIIHLKSVESQVLDNGVGYARIKNFQRGTATELARTLTSLQRKGGTRGLVLDLRGNPGGLLDEAVRVCDLLMDDGPVVITVADAGRLRDVRSAQPAKTWRQLPVAVLVNNRSASASEIVAGALKHSGRAIVVGEQTFGKGTVQVPYEIGEGALKLTVAKYLVPGDVDIQDRGVTPDIAIRFIAARRDRVRLFDQADAQRAQRRPWLRLDEHQQLRTRPSHRLLPVLPGPRPAAKGVGAEGTAVETASQLRDREPIRRAARLLRYAGSDSGATTLAEAKAQIAEMQEADDKALTEQLMAAGIDWRPGPREGEPRLRLKLAVPADGFTVTAGRTLRVSVTLHNEGDKALYRLHVVSHSDEPAFDGIEQVVGRLEPGASRTVEMVARTSRRHVGVRAPVRFVAAQDGMVLDARDVVTIALRPLPRPDLWFRWQLDDGPSPAAAPAEATVVGDGFLEPKEEARLRVTVRNAGDGPAPKLVASLRSLSGQRLHLEQGRTRLGPLAPQSEVAAIFSVVGERGDHPVPGGLGAARADVGLLGARLELADEALGYVRRQRLYLPWAAGPRSPASAGAQAPGMQALQRIKTLAEHAATQWNRAPVIRLGGPGEDDIEAGLVAPLRGECLLELRGHALFESSAPKRRFVTVTVGETKRSYHAGHGEDRLDFLSRLRLDTGMNRVTIQAQAGPELSAQRRLYAHCTNDVVPPRADEQETR